MSYILMTGDSASGFQFAGPFVSHREAEEYAAAQNFGQYEVCEMTKPGYEELKPWPSSEKAARDLGFNVDSPSWDDARKDWADQDKTPRP